MATQGDAAKIRASKDSDEAPRSSKRTRRLTSHAGDELADANEAQRRRAPRHELEEERGHRTGEEQAKENRENELPA